jgi:release factor glutamine methyltransferase
MRLRALLHEAGAGIGGESPRADAELLLAHVLGATRGWLIAHDDADVDDDAVVRFRALAARRRDGVPVALLVGRQAFWSLELALGRDTLVPRPDTESLVELALERIPHDTVVEVLDLGTGSGAIALAIAAERPRARVTAVDLAEGAIEVARANAARLALPLRLRAGDWFAAVPGEVFDLIVSNPPYLAEDDHHLPDLRHEPRLALVSGAEGFDAIDRIVAGAGAALRAGGALLFEHGWEQGEGARARLRDAGFAEVETWQDLEGRDRVSGGTWRGA